MQWLPTFGSRRAAYRKWWILNKGSRQRGDDKIFCPEHVVAVTGVQKRDGTGRPSGERTKSRDRSREGVVADRT